MNVGYLSCLLLLTVLHAGARQTNNDDFIRNLVDRRLRDPPELVDSIRGPEDLPPGEKLLPGHTLLRPESSMLKSAVKYPLRDLPMLVYGNIENLGKAYGRNERVLYSDFRKSNQRQQLVQGLLDLLKTVQNANQDEVIDLPLKMEFSEEINVDEDVGAEEMFESDEEDFRRKSSKTMYRDRKKKYSGSDGSESASSDYEKNPGNPFTVHKNRYKQNYHWNHFMDGDHMNLSPFAPSFQSATNNAANFFFARKWWYFHQDDYKPF